MTAGIIICLIIVFISSAKNGLAEFNYLLNSFELAKTADVREGLKIRHCVLVQYNHHQGGTIGNFKKFSKETIMTTTMSHEELIEYFQIGSFPNANTLIIMKEINLLKIIEMFENFESIVIRANRFTWLAFVETFNSTERQKLNIPYNCRFLIGSPIKENEMKLVEVYKVKNQSFSFEFDLFDNEKLSDYLYLRRTNLNGTQMVINSDGRSVQAWQAFASGRQMEILTDIAKMLNFHCSYKKLNFVVNLKNLNFDGDMYSLAYPFLIDFFTTDFLGPMFKTTLNWKIKYPNIENRGDYIEPFHSDLWFCISSFIIFNSLVLIIIATMLKEKVSTVEVAFVGLDSVCYQNGNRDIRENYFRIIIFSLRLIALVVIPAYNAVIISYLAIRIPDVPFRNLKEFSNNERYLIALPKHTFVEYYFKDKNDPTLKHIYSNLSLIFNFNQLGEITQRFCDEDLVLPVPDNSWHSTNISCDTLLIEEPIAFTLSGIILKKNSPFKEVLNYKLLWFYSAGIQEKLQKRSEEHQTINPIGTTLDPVEIKQIIQVLFVGGVGAIASVVIFILEIYCKNVALL